MISMRPAWNYWSARYVAPLVKSLCDEPKYVDQCEATLHDRYSDGPLIDHVTVALVARVCCAIP